MYLKEWRTKKDFTMKKLSEETGISLRTLEDIQRRGDCLLSNAIKIALVLEVSIDDLCSDPQTLET